jgi:hypothetical protein
VYKEGVQRSIGWAVTAFGGLLIAWSVCSHSWWTTGDSYGAKWGKIGPIGGTRCSEWSTRCRAENMDRFGEMFSIVGPLVVIAGLTTAALIGLMILTRRTYARTLQIVATVAMAFGVWLAMVIDTEREREVAFGMSKTSLSFGLPILIAGGLLAIAGSVMLRPVRTDP